MGGGETRLSSEFLGGEGRNLLALLVIGNLWHKWQPVYDGHDEIWKKVKSEYAKIKWRKKKESLTSESNPITILKYIHMHRFSLEHYAFTCKITGRT